MIQQALPFQQGPSQQGPSQQGVFQQLKPPSMIQHDPFQHVPSHQEPPQQVPSQQVPFQQGPQQGSSQQRHPKQRPPKQIPPQQILPQQAPIQQLLPHQAPSRPPEINPIAFQQFLQKNNISFNLVTPEEQDTKKLTESIKALLFKNDTRKEEPFKQTRKEEPLKQSRKEELSIPKDDVLPKILKLNTTKETTKNTLVPPSAFLKNLESCGLDLSSVRTKQDLKELIIDAVNNDNFLDNLFKQLR